MTDLVKININLSTGEVGIEAPADALVTIFDRLETFLPKMATEASIDENPHEQGSVISEETTNTTKLTETPVKPKTKTKKATTKSSGTKPESYKTVDLGLTTEERQQFKEFYQSKAPANQSDHVLVVIYWLIKNTNKAKLTIDEIFTGLRTVGEKIPKRITSVLSNLSLASYITKENNEPTLLHIGEDYIDHELPKKKEQ